MRSQTIAWGNVAIWSAISAAVFYTIGLRLSVMGSSPLWLDESWTAAAWRSPDFSALAHYLYVDANAPLYSLFIWLWPGESNFLLRLPTLVFAITGGLIAATARLPGTDKGTSAMWGAALLLWTPGLALFSEARCYGLLELFSVLQTVSFVRLIHDPSRRLAFHWTSFAVLSCLTHYYAGLSAIVEGLAIVAVHRSRALRLWPALILTIPLITWGIYHLSRLQEYGAPGVAWYQVIRPKYLVHFLTWPVAQSAIALLMMIAFLVIWRRRVSRPITVVTLSSIFCVIIYVLIGSLRPAMTERYMLPVVPPILLGLAAAVRPRAYVGLAAAWLISMPSPAQFRNYYESKAWFGLEKAARYLPNANKVSWYLDDGISAILDQSQRDPLLVDAFERNGRKIEPGFGVGPDALIYLFKLKSESRADAISRSRRCQRFYVVIWDWGVLICEPQD